MAFPSGETEATVTDGMPVSHRTREVRLARFAQAVGAHPGLLIERIAAMTAEEILEHDDVSVYRSPAGWIVRLGDGGVSLAKTPERAVHYVNDRLRLGEEVLARQLDRLLRDPAAGDDSPTYAEARTAGIIVQFSPLRGGFQTLSVDEARRYLAWLEAGNHGAPYEMDERP